MWSEKIIFVVPVLMALAASLPALQDAANNTGKTSESWANETRHRLPNNSVPRLYRINIEPSLSHDALTWSGECSIDVEIMAPTRSMTLHAFRNLVIDENSTSLVNSAGRKHQPIQQIRDVEFDFLILVFEQDIPVGNHTLNLKFNGTDYGLIGFYKASDSRSDSPVAATHFEPITARLAFPCWDEPGFKSRYRMSIKHHPNYTALSNMPAIDEIATGDGKILTTFDTTPVMSVYLLTFVISGHESVSNEFGNVTVWAEKNHSDGFLHILNTSQKAVDFMEAYTGLPFGCARLGSVIVPVYTSSATEHWGLISYRDAMVKYIASEDTTSQLDRANLLIAHELSHSWFGNRVTPKWWDDLWLNEAFASYFQFIITAEFYGYSDLSGFFVVSNNQQVAFPLDLNEDERQVPIKWSPPTNREIGKVFARLTYRKGAAILHMFHNVLSPEIFRSGIRKYLTRHSYEGVEADDLLAALQEAYDENSNGKAPLNVKETMMTWLGQTGSPIINITRNYTTGDTRVTQRSLVLKDSTTKWWIPLNYATKTNPNFSSTAPITWMSNKHANVVINGIDPDDWVIFNIQASGYFRVNYDDENWKRIVEYMDSENYTNIHVNNRAQIINDLFTFAKEEPLIYGKHFWKLTKYLSRETEYIPWKAALAALRSIDGVFGGTSVRGTLQTYVLGLMENFIQKVGYETRDDDDHLTKLARETLIEWACISGHAGCHEFSVRKLQKFVENPVENRLHPDNALAISCSGLGGLNDSTSAIFVQNWTEAHGILFNNYECMKNHEIDQNTLDSSRGNPNEKRLLTPTLNNIFLESDENFNFGIVHIVQNNGIITIYTESSSDDPSYTMPSHAFKMIDGRVRSKKRNNLLGSDVVGKKKNQSKAKLLSEAEKKVADVDKNVAKFLTL